MSFVTFILGVIVGAIGWEKFGTQIKTFIAEKRK